VGGPISTTWSAALQDFTTAPAHDRTRARPTLVDATKELTMSDSVSVRDLGTTVDDLAERIAVMDAKIDTILEKVEGLRLVLRDTANGPSGTLYTMVAAIKSILEDD
jgi:hypothetical protein